MSIGENKAQYLFGIAQTDIDHANCATRSVYMRRCYISLRIWMCMFVYLDAILHFAKFVRKYNLCECNSTIAELAR